MKWPYVFASLSLFFAAALGGCASTKAPTPPAVVDDPDVVAVVAGEVITLDEFERHYAKSVGSFEAALNDSLPAYQDFLRRYVDYRLKVAEARKAGFANDPALQQEIDAYRKRVARPYLAEHEILEPLMRDLYDRMQEVVSASHILIRVDENASPADTLAAYQRATALLDSLQAGADFGGLAAAYSEDPSAKMEGRPGYRGKLGFLAAGATVPAFEDMLYATAVGDVSPVFRSRFGYHILRVEDRKPNAPDRRIAHIYMQPTGSAAQDSAQVIPFLQGLKARVAAGESFADLAREYSQHGPSADNGGDPGMYVSYYANHGLPESFKQTAFALEHVGDVSDIVTSPYGYHLIQLTGIRSLDDYAALRDDLRATASRLPQAQAAYEAYFAEVQQKHGLEVDSTAAYRALDSASPDALLARIQAHDLAPGVLSTPIIELGDSTYTVADVAAFAPSARISRQDSTRTYVRNLLKAFVSERTFDMATADLVARNEDLQRTMHEFSDGLLLFRIMEDSVWNAAGRDSVALRAHFEAHRAKFQFPDRTRLLAFSSARDTSISDIVVKLDGGISVEQVITEGLADGRAVFEVDTTYVTPGETSPYSRALGLRRGEHSEMFTVNEQYIVVVRDRDESARPMTFEEAHGQVAADYQQVLERALVERLRNEYQPRIYPERLGAAFSEPHQSTVSAKLSVVQE